jgi:hypothetical protein
LQNLILRHIYRKSFLFVLAVSLHLHLKFVKSANMIKKLFFQKSSMGIKKTKSLKLISNPLEKLQKLMQRKSINEKVTNMVFFYIYYCAQTFSASNFFGELF